MYSLVKLTVVKKARHGQDFKLKRELMIENLY